ncbi:LysR family transcriptional regulator [Robbsia sp. KACC 23696]|uniref:LysR family transcriptional regulator n=1 Tax=Robbsia sp. KACC 23696 TaxID=3149231 RepID=UPI00325B1E12
MARSEDVLLPAHAALLNVRGLRYLNEIETHGGVRAAADALGINASVISRQLARLEREHRVTLLERHGRRVSLSEVGRSLAEYFRESGRRDAAMLARLDDYRGLRRGRIGVGLGEGRVETIMATVLGPFSSRFPDIVLDLRSGMTRDVVTMVRNGEVDLAVCTGGNDDPAIHTRSFTAAPCCALVSPSHPLAGARNIGFDALRGERLIFLPQRFNVQQYIDSIIHADRLDLKPSYRCDHFSSALAIAAAGLGVAFMSSDAAKLYIETHKLVALELDHPITRSLQTHALRRVGVPLSPAAEALWKALLSALKKRADQL